jgi:hypothetical protein
MLDVIDGEQSGDMPKNLDETGDRQLDRRHAFLAIDHMDH